MIRSLFVFCHLLNLKKYKALHLVLNLERKNNLDISNLYATLLYIFRMIVKIILAELVSKGKLYIYLFI